jgi:hypothetical protein
MQLIRAINKSNKSNNNNQTSSGSNSKVVIVAPPATHSSVSQSQPPQPSQAPVSPSVALPALKKRTTIVKQSVPPPVPPRGSPRSKSKSIGVSSSRRKPTIDVTRLATLSSLEQSGCQKVEKWLETVETPAGAIPEEFEFQSVRKLAETFTQRRESIVKSMKAHRKVSDSSLVRLRIDNYDSLASGRLRHLISSDTGTDSGIDIPARATSRPSRQLPRTTDRFSHDEEFV